MPIPEKIKLGDKEYVLKDHPELMEIVQETRKEEKTKLYAEKASLEAKIKTLEDEQKAKGDLSATKEKELKELREELGAVKSDKEKLEKEIAEAEKGKKKPEPKKEDEPKGLTKEDVQALLKDALAEQAKEHKKEIEKVQGGLTAKEVSDYRKEQLAKHEGIIIAKLVPEGLKSKEDVNKAIEEALAESKQYITNEYEVEEGKKQRMTIAEWEKHQADVAAAEEEKKKGTGTYTPPQHPDKPDGGSGGDLTGKELLGKIGEMSDEEYEKNRDAIMKEVKAVKYQDTGE